MSIDHSLQFEYSALAFVEPLILRLTPASTAFQRVECFELMVDPVPVGIASIVDVWGFEARVVRFESPTTRLLLQARSTVQTLCENPFDFVLTDPGTFRIPVAYGAQLTDGLGPTLRLREESSDAMDRLLAETTHATEGRTLDFLYQLCHRINTQLQCRTRPDGPPRPASETLKRGVGACRDLAMVFIEACRHVGLAARFASGYYLDPEPSGAPELHAWAEVFLPGGGWRGYDPSQGLLVADRHILLTAAHTPPLAAASQGAFRGDNVQSTLTASVSLTSLAD